MKKNVNLKKNMKAMLAVFVCLFVLLGSFLMYNTVVNGDQWFSAPYNPRIMASKNVENAGSIYDRNGVKLAYTQDGERKYQSNEDIRRAVSHVVGDVKGMSLGAETLLAKYLYGFDQNVMDKITSAASGTRGGDVYLTIDAELSEYVYDNMDAKGAAVLMNYETGEILASVSKPTFDPMNIVSEDAEDTGAKYVNRATQGKYPPGSTMKIVTTAAALENGIDDFTMVCTGADVIDGQRITCPKDGGHGEVNLEKAFEKSCNVYYAHLSTKLGEEKMNAAAEKFAFNYNFKFPDFTLYQSQFETSGLDGDLAWAGIGQYKDLVTPMHDMLIAAGIANGGMVVQPNLLLDVTYGASSGYNYKTTGFKQVTDAATAAQISEFMRKTVESGTATSADISAVPVCGKTGTAEFMQDGEKKNHSWFVGFSQDTDHPLAIAIIGEGAGFGSSYATPLAGRIINRAVEMGY